MMRLTEWFYRCLRTSALLDRLAALSSIVTRIRNKIVYRGIAIHHTANLLIQGSLIYDKHCIINEGSNIVIPPNTVLTLGKESYIGRYTELCPRQTIHIGAETSIQDRCIFLGDISIGRYCVFATGVYLSSGRHYYDLVPYLNIRDQDEFVRYTKEYADIHSQPIQIEDDCWLGMNVVVMSGVTIGKGAIVGANSVVTKDVEPYTVVAGSPAKLIKKRLDFIPPRSISFDQPTDWPYFYSGFEVSEAARSQYEPAQGIAAQKKFAFALDVTDGKYIHVRIRSLAAPECMLVFGDQQKTVTTQWQDITFALGPGVGDRQEFFLASVDCHSDAIVQKVWIL